jgi:transposase
VTLAQSPTGYNALPRSLQAADVAPASAQVVMEATSTYWVVLAVSLRGADRQVFVINPTRAHSLANAQLRRAKTDTPDPQDIARLADKLGLTPWALPAGVNHEPRHRLLARDALISWRQQARNQGIPWSSDQPQWSRRVVSSMK